MSGLLPPNGSIVAPTKFSVPRAKELAGFLSRGETPYARLIECRAADPREIVVLEVEVELPQEPVHEIERFERVAVEFDRADRHSPEVLALREDFPSVPHLNLRDEEFPRSLCLYDRPFRETKATWTAAGFVEWLRHWLALTAKGKLHQEDQPLEPVLLVGNHRVVLPANFPDRPEGERSLIQLRSVQLEKTRTFFVAEERSGEEQRGVEALATSLCCRPQTHGIIRRKPATLADLAELLQHGEVDVVASLRDTLTQWVQGASEDKKERNGILSAWLVLVVSFPKMRKEEEEVEQAEWRAFFLGEPIFRIGERVGAWTVIETNGVKDIGFHVGASEATCTDKVPVEVLSVSWKLDHSRSAELNGCRPWQFPAVAIGVGALGSQVVLNAYRAGFGEWTLIDEDLLLPHNLARHALNGFALGATKVQAVAYTASSILDAPRAVQGIEADFLDPGTKKTEVDAALSAARLIVDTSASVAVARALARDPAAQSRAVSLFLNPTGSDLVLLAEDSERTVRLDALEMQLYRALIREESLAGHLQPTRRRIRYGQSCRDISSQVPQDLVGLHAAIGSHALSKLPNQESGGITVWRASEDRTVSRIDVQPCPVKELALDEWTLLTDDVLLRRLAELREERLPNETGGVLIGAFDAVHRRAYVVDTIRSPPDSVEWPDLYIRGCRGLAPQIRAIEEATDGMLHYIGEWHAHPEGSGTRASEDDIKVFGWLTKRMARSGLPPLMMIVGDDHARPFLTTITAGEGARLAIPDK